MKGATTVCAALVILAASSSSTAAAGHTQVGKTPSASVTATFRLVVSGQADSSLTFWVAYGPLRDGFGLVQLHPAGQGRYRASVTLPAEGRTVFAFLAGHGTIRTRFGPAPGNPVVTIRRIGPVNLAELRLPTVRWMVPAG
jgi:hypothetical protein